MKLTLYIVSLTATGLIAIPAVSMAHGVSAHHMSAMETHDNDRDHDRYRYSGIYFGPPYGAHGVSYYHADYCYTPTAEQIVTAQEQVKDYLLAVKKHRKRAAIHRYISVETRRPTKKQLDDYTKKRSEGNFAAAPGGSESLSGPVHPSKLRCLMVYDIQTKQFVGSACYLVSGEPPIGEVLPQSRQSRKRPLDQFWSKEFRA
jgi:hypothetical protein